MNDTLDDLDDYKKPWKFEGDIEDWGQFHAVATYDGYGDGPAPRNPNALVDGQSIDEEVARAGICAVCNSQCEYRALSYHDGNRIRHRAFAVCVKCNTAQEM